MKTFVEFITEAKRTPWPKGVTKGKATASEISKGESYTVVNTKEKTVLWVGLKRTAAKEVTEYLDNKDIEFGSGSYINDKYIQAWN